MANIQEISLFDVIGEKKDKYEYSFLTTYNAYLPFYEQIVLRRLIKTGCRVNTLLMVSGQFTECFAGLSGTPLLAGRDYTLIPVDAGSGVFHPKILLLLGKENATLCVGSHNLTLSGFGKNRELTSLFEFNSNSSPQKSLIFQKVWQALKNWSSDQPAELLDSFRYVENEIEWLNKNEDFLTDDSAQFFAVKQNTDSLWEQVKPILPSKIGRISMISPFFDENFRFIREIMESVNPREIIIGIEPNTVCLPLNGFHQFPNIKFVNALGLGNNHGYLHAKAIYFEGERGDNLLISGSANLSSPAWLKSNHRNCEAIIALHSKEANNAAKIIGLDQLTQSPLITESEWQQIEKNRENRTELFSQKFKSVILAAVETDNGFKIFPKKSNLQFISTVELLNALGKTSVKKEITEISDEEIFIEVSDSQVRFSTNTIKLQSTSGEIYFTFVHHTTAIISKFNKVEHREFFTALESFDIPIDNKFWRIFEQIVFNEGDELPEYMEVNFSEPSGSDNFKVKTNDTETLQATFSVKTAKIDFNDRLNQNLTDSLSELISLLNRRLYSQSGQTPIFSLSSDANPELDESEEFETEELVDHKTEAENIASHYYQRTRTMMRRMTKKLDLINTPEFRPRFAVLRQIAVVLGLLHWIKQFEKHEKFANLEKEFISLDDEWKLFISGVSFLSKLENISSEIRENSNRFNEVFSLVVGYLLWLSFDCGLDITKIYELRNQKYGEDRLDGWTNNEILEGTAALLKLAIYFGEDQHAQATFKQAVPEFQDDELIKQNLDWLKLIYQTSINLSNLPGSKRKPRIGDFVIQTRMKKPEMLIISNDPSFIELVVLSAENRRRKFSAETVTVIENLTENYI